jgi:hypothetical protein
MAALTPALCIQMDTMDLDVSTILGLSGCGIFLSLYETL